MTKQELRTYYLNQRGSLSELDIIDSSSKINHLLKDEFIGVVNKIHTFIPIPNSHEINVWGFIHYCWENNILTATSTTHFNPKRLEHTWFNEGTEFEAGVYDLPTPKQTSEVDLSEIDLVIVPLLCIDNKGNRIGYGQGFYDGFLLELPPETKKIGVSLFDVLDETISPDPWDIKLDGAATKDEIIYFE